MGRVEAARALGKKGDKEAIAALGKAAREDGFWGVQAEAARALGSIRSNAALDELLASTGVQHPKARRAVVRALGEFREERAAEALEGVVDNGDASYYVEAAATAAIGKTRSTRGFRGAGAQPRKGLDERGDPQQRLRRLLRSCSDERAVPTGDGVVAVRQAGQRPRRRGVALGQAGRDRPGASEGRDRRPPDHAA